jgi:hypothetical protein
MAARAKNLKLSQVVDQVIDLASRIRAYWDAELPKRHPDYPLVRAGEDTGPPPPEEAELQTLLRNLPPQVVYQLILIMYLGRGDFDPADLQASFEYVPQTFGKPEWAISQMMEKAPLADYLADGLEQLRKRNVDVDNLPVKTPQTARK